jgi:hypothetical protein
VPQTVKHTCCRGAVHDGACIMDRDKPTVELVVKSYGYADALSALNGSGRPDSYKAVEYTEAADRQN